MDGCRVPSTMHLTAFSIAALVRRGLPVPLFALAAQVAVAYDTNALDRHLQHQQWTRVQNHQMAPATPASQTAPASRGNRAQADASACSAEALPAADRRRMEAEYHRILRSQGRASADAWVHEQGRLFRQKLVAQGVCPPASESAPAPAPAAASPNPAAPASQANRTSTARDATGNESGCRMRMAPIANLGGGMTMGMVPDCGDDK